MRQPAAEWARSAVRRYRRPPPLSGSKRAAEGVATASSSRSPNSRTPKSGSAPGRRARRRSTGASSIGPNWRIAHCSAPSRPAIGPTRRRPARGRTHQNRGRLLHRPNVLQERSHSRTSSRERWMKNAAASVTALGRCSATLLRPRRPPQPLAVQKGGTTRWSCRSNVPSAGGDPAEGHLEPTATGARSRREGIGKAAAARAASRGGGSNEGNLTRAR